MLYLKIDSEGTLFFWPINVVDPSDPNDWTISQHQAAVRSRDTWIRLLSDRNLSAYIIQLPLGDLPPAKWPKEIDLDVMLEKAFRGKIIDDINHDVIKKLRGIPLK